MKTNVLQKTIIWVLLFCLAFSLAIVLAGPAGAEVSEYSGVMEDLSSDATFDISSYPIDVDNVIDSDDFSVISIALSNESDLFIYTYNADFQKKALKAVKISLYFGYIDNPEKFTPRLYDLELLSTVDGFSKYKVSRLIVPTGMTYVNIYSIYREKCTLDEEYLDTSVNYIAHGVGQQWCYYFYNDEIKYEKGVFKTLKLEVKLTDFVRLNYQPLFAALGMDHACDAHYIAFSCEQYVIEHIYDADLVYYARKRYTRTGLQAGISDFVKYYSFYDTAFENPVDATYYDGPLEVTLTDKQEAITEAQGFLEKTYTWKRIATAKDFVKNYKDQGVVFAEETLGKLNESEWVFSFVETDFELTTNIMCSDEKRTEIKDVAIMRVHFMDNRGQVYNLGVVSNITSDDGVPGAIGGGMDFDDLFGDLFSKIEYVLLIIVAVLALVFLATFCPWIFTFIWAIIKLIFKALWWVISFPFNLIGKLFKKRKRDKKNE